MKILHTSDWHLGRKLMGIDRIEEQKQILAEISEIADAQNVDIIICAGDVFDTPIPDAQAERAFYEAVLRMSGEGRRLVVICAGNHDDATRLTSASAIASLCGVVIVGGMDFVAPQSTQFYEILECGRGYIKLKKNGETAVLALFGFISDYRMYKDIGQKHDCAPDFTQRVLNYMEMVTDKFSDQTINILTAHIYALNAVKSGEESDLGTAMRVDPVRLNHAHYTALGHIHKYLAINKENAVYYSGSIAQYSFDDCIERCVLVAELDKNGLKGVDKVLLKSAKRLIKLSASSVEEGRSLLDGNTEDYIELTLKLSLPLTDTEYKSLKRANLAQLKIELPKKKTAVFENAMSLTPKELFLAYYKSLTNKQPSDELMDLFLEVAE